MTNARRFVPPLAALLALSGAAGAGDPVWSKPAVVANRSIPCITYRARIAGEWLLVEMKPAPGWHSFALDNQQRAEEALAGKKSLGIEASTKIEPLDELQLVGPWRQPEPLDLSKPDLRWYTFGFDSKTLLACRINPDTLGPAGRRQAEIRITGQACNDSSCRNIDLKVTIAEPQITAGTPDLRQLKPVKNRSSDPADKDSAQADKQPSPSAADVAAQLARMLAAHPTADANGDGTLTEDEAGRYILRKVQRKRPNRGPGMRASALIDLYEPGSHPAIGYRLMKPIRTEPGRRYPLVISLHGSGGIGDDNLSSLRFWNGVMAQRQWREEYPCYVLVPQRRPGGYWGPKPNDQRVADLYIRNELLPVFELIDELKQKHPIDNSRIYALGSSGGGVGTWNILLARPELFAAAIPVCGRFRAEGDDLAKLSRIPIWCFHGDADPLVEVENSRQAFQELTAAGAVIKYTELRGVKHNSWIQAFTYNGDDDSKGYVTRYSNDRCDRSEDVWKWLFAQRKP